jgi:DHA1 family multidrug resistance protein-like MFS transporter
MQFNGLGVNWASTLLGCVAVLLIPIPVFFYFYGAKLREKSKFAPTYFAAVQANDAEMGNVETHED